MATRAQNQNDADTVSASMRIDKLLYYLRFVKSRSIAQMFCESGHMRINGKRVRSRHVNISVGSIVTMPRGDDVIVFEIADIPKRRGPASEAAVHYNLLNS